MRPSPVPLKYSPLKCSKIPSPSHPPLCSLPPEKEIHIKHTIIRVSIHRKNLGKNESNDDVVVDNDGGCDDGCDGGFDGGCDGGCDGGSDGGRDGRGDGGGVG